MSIGDNDDDVKIPDPKQVSLDPEIFDQQIGNTDLNTKFNGLDIDELYQFLATQTQAAGEELESKQEEVLEMVEFLSRYEVVVNI